MVTVDTYWAKVFVGFKNTDMVAKHLQSGMEANESEFVKFDVEKIIGQAKSESAADKIPVLPDPMDTTRGICSKYVNRAGLCVALTPTEYVYSNSHGDGYAGEPGVEIGFINYPRIPSEPQKIREQALELARMLKMALEQHRVTVMFPDETVMLGELD